MHLYIVDVQPWLRSTLEIPKYWLAALFGAIVTTNATSLLLSSGSLLLEVCFVEPFSFNIHVGMGHLHVSMCYCSRFFLVDNLLPSIAWRYLGDKAPIHEPTRGSSMRFRVLDELFTSNRHFMWLNMDRCLLAGMIVLMLEDALFAEKLKLPRLPTTNSLGTRVTTTISHP